MDKLIVSNAPHIHTSDSSRRVMLDVVIALLPATVAAVVIFGTGALKVIAACVIGGVSFNGGIGTVPGVVIGSIILQAINYGLYFLGVNAYLQYIIRGAIIIIAVTTSALREFAPKKKSGKGAAK